MPIFEQEEVLMTDREGNDAALYDRNDYLLGILHLEEKYQCDKEKEASAVLKTTDQSHPGVQYLQHDRRHIPGWENNPA